jgi:hypothetical protein
VDGSDGAAVRVALTVQASEAGRALRYSVDGNGFVIEPRRVHQLNTDLSAHADVAGASSTVLQANIGVCSDGVKLHGSGFMLDAAEADELIRHDASYSDVVRRYANGRDIAQSSRDMFVIDFALRSEEEARQYVVPFQIVRDRVKPERDSNNDRRTRERWWAFGRNRDEFRPALGALSRYIVTVDTARHRYFIFVDRDLVVDDKLVAIASADSSVLGVLSSRIHVAWADAVGTRLGVGNDPVYVKTRCFDAFPFPQWQESGKAAVSDCAEILDAHRKSAILRDAVVTMTGMYNVVAKLRSGDPLTGKERRLHEIAGCGALRDLHDELDAFVADAFGWPWPMEREEILERLVSLHGERLEEEKRGVIRWLRPDYQIPRFAPKGAAPSELALVPREPAAASTVDDRRPWPSTAVEQLAAVSASVAQAPRSVDEVAAAFSGARKDLVARHLETLAMMGEISLDADNRYRSALRVA